VGRAWREAREKSVARRILRNGRSIAAAAEAPWLCGWNLFEHSELLA
jgi:hypothetical protein